MLLSGISATITVSVRSGSGVCAVCSLRLSVCAAGRTVLLCESFVPLSAALLLSSCHLVARSCWSVAPFQILVGFGDIVEE